MISYTHRLACQAAAALVLAQAGAALADAPRPPAAAFFDNAPFSHPQLSPNGKLLAVIVGAADKRDGLAVIDLADNKVHSVARFADVDVGKVQWVNDKRLAFDTTNKNIAPGEREHGPGLYAANFDGSDFKQLAQRRSSRIPAAKPGSAKGKLQPYNTYLTGQPGAQNSDALYVVSPDLVGAVIRTVDLLELDTVTGRVRKTDRAGDTHYWLLDHEGQPRLTSTLDGTILTIHQRDPATKAWKKLTSFNAYTGGPDAFTPLAFGPDGTLYVISNAGKDKAAVHTVDLATGKLSEKALITLADYDFQGKLIISRNKLVGFRATTDAETTMWFDPQMKALQDEIDKLLDNTVNLLSVPSRPETPWVLVESYSDVQPKTLRLFNTQTKVFNLIGSTRPAIDPVRMGRQESVRYTARDGLGIPALLTMPSGERQARLPLVLLVHGGPWVRGTAWGWKDQAQFLASRGYAVLEPEFRGSRGYGNAHFRAGWKQWGLKMQDDIADGAKWAIAKGLADPQRICIAGASYGGYAALMGLVNDPGLFKCGINWVGVTDIELMYNGHWSQESDAPDAWLDYGMPVLIGDKTRDAAQLQATSPLVQAARIKQPLLLAYGDADKRVPIYHGDKFYKAVRQTNPDVEWVVYEGEGHGWAVAGNRIDFWTRVEKFLERHIGKP
ncbi:MAG: prolyl oligopeptidase family serine peptidase [Telluria sp.]|nr:prolyl oligopeptidase family serine peptidase [Telluria sp.]